MLKKWMVFTSFFALMSSAMATPQNFIEPEDETLVAQSHKRDYETDENLSLLNNLQESKKAESDLTLQKEIPIIFFPSKIEKNQALQESHEFSSLSNIRLEALGEILILKVSNFLFMEDMCLLEQTSKRFSQILKNSYQYRSLISDFKDEGNKENIITLPTTLSFKDKFLNLKKENPEFQIHFINLKRKFFPNFKFELGLAYYTDKKLTLLQLEKVSKTYHKYWGENKKFLEKSEYVASSYLGFIQTQSEGELSSEMIIELENFLKNDHYSPQFHNEIRLHLVDFNTKNSPELAKKYCEAVINTSNDNNTEKWKAQLRLIEMDFPIIEKQNSKTEVLISIEKIQSILGSSYVDPETKINALLDLAFLYTLEKDNLKPKYLIASKFLEYAINSPLINEEKKIDIFFDLADLYFYKGNEIGDLNSHHILARKYYEIVFNSSLPESERNINLKQKAFNNLTFIDRQGLSTANNKPNYKAILERGEAYLTFRIYSNIKANVRLYLSDKYRKGIGCPDNIPDFKAARRHLELMKGKERDFTPSPAKEEGWLMLAEMDYLGQGIEGDVPDYDSAIKAYEKILRSEFCSYTMRQEVQRSLYIISEKRNHNVPQKLDQ